MGLGRHLQPRRRSRATTGRSACSRAASRPATAASRCNTPTRSSRRFGYDRYVSALGLATRQPDGSFALDAEPFIAPTGDVDRYGCEDARVTRLGDRWWITYTALAEPAATATHGVGIALASTTDWVTVERHGRIGPAVRDKDAALFPERVGGRIAMFHRIAPDVQIVFFEDEEQMLAPGARFWEHALGRLDDSVVLRPEQTWEAKKVGMGPPPIATDDGWLVVYHAADADHVYRAGLALLDRDDPRRVIARTRQPVLEPRLDWERAGDVPNVVFPQGATVEDGTLNLYYGAADCAIGHAHAPLADVLDLLREEAQTPDASCHRSRSTSPATVTGSGRSARPPFRPSASTAGRRSSSPSPTTTGSRASS